MTETTHDQPQGWAESFRAFLHPRVITMLFFGFSAGIPLLLIFSSLSLWLGEAGVERKSVTFFSWAALPYSFKFVWAPLIDRLPLPFLTAWLGRRRAWLLVAQCLIMLAVVLMGMVDPASGQDNLVRMALAAVLLGFSAATQDIVIDAYRIESAESRLQAMMSSTYIAGYRLAMVASGAGALFLAASFGSEKGHYVYGAWQSTYLIMASTMLVGMITTLLVSEPERKQADRHHYATADYVRLLAVFAGAVLGFVGTFFFGADLFASLKEMAGDGVLSGFLLEALHFILAVAVAVLIGWLLVLAGVVNRGMARDTWVEPIADFFQRYGLTAALLVLALVGFYRISDIVLGVISNVFYQDMGFSKVEIATAVKTFGVIVSIAGGFAGGLLVTRFGVMRILMLGAALAVAANAVFILLANLGHNVPMMYLAVGFDNFEAGLAGAAFIAFLSSLTSVSFTAVQYAIFSSLMTLFPKVIGGYSGTIVDGIGYPGFFTFTSLIGVPVMLLVWLVSRHLKVE